MQLGLRRPNNPSTQRQTSTAPLLTSHAEAVSAVPHAQDLGLIRAARQEALAVADCSAHARQGPAASPGAQGVGHVQAWPRALLLSIVLHGDLHNVVALLVLPLLQGVA